MLLETLWSISQVTQENKRQYNVYALMYLSFRVTKKMRT